MNKPILKFLFSILSGVSILSCSQTSTHEISENMQNKPIKTTRSMASVDSNWLSYADPIADANLAIQNNQLALLSFSGRGTSFPGLDSQQTDILTQTCGKQFLPDSSDVLTSQNELKYRKKLYQYAVTYNKIVAKACKNSP